MKSVRIFLCILIFTLFTFGCSPTDLPNAEDSIEKVIPMPYKKDE